MKAFHLCKPRLSCTLIFLVMFETLCRNRFVADAFPPFSMWSCSCRPFSHRDSLPWIRDSRIRCFSVYAQGYPVLSVICDHGREFLMYVCRSVSTGLQALLSLMLLMVDLMAVQSSRISKACVDGMVLRFFFGGPWAAGGAVMYSFLTRDEQLDSLGGVCLWMR
jgi:hypothetical protein